MSVAEDNYHQGNDGDVIFIFYESYLDEPLSLIEEQGELRV